MITTEQIQEVGRKIGTQFQPERVILFGSYAHGKPGKNSDVDLLVIMQFEGKSAYQAMAMRMQVKFPFPVDLIVRTPESIRERLAIGDRFIRKILEDGKILYEADHP